MDLKFKSVVLAGALTLLATPVFAQDMMMPNIDLDPFHILTPAPAAAPAAMPMMHHKHMMMHHKHMMMHHKMKMMHHKKMMMMKK